MYLAGQASVSAAPAGSPGRWLWPAATAAMTLVAATLAVLLVVQPAAAVRERVVYVPVQSPAAQPLRAVPSEQQPLPTPPSAAPPVAAVATLPETHSARMTRGTVPRLPVPDATAGYLHLREFMLSYGVDSLPLTSQGGAGPADAPASRQDLLESLLDRRPEQPKQPEARLSPWNRFLFGGESS